MISIKKVINPFLNLFKKNTSGSAKSVFRKDSMGLNLQDVIKNSYNPQSNLNGFVRDDELSGKRQQVYLNPENNQLLFSVAGTRSGTDIINDIRLATGGLKNTNRYKSADNTLKLAKEKYPEASVNIVGSSLGGSITQRLGGANDRRITYNAGEVFGINRPNTVNVRHSGDVVSLLGANKSYNFGNPLLVASPFNWLSNHSSDQLKGENIFM